MAVVRLKRQCNEEPIDALLLTCKRIKTEEDHLSSIFKFAATVNDQDENVSKHISKVVRSFGSKSSYKSPNITNITDRLRAENKLFSQNSRLKVVNCFRALSETDSLEDSEGPSVSDRTLTIVDIETLPFSEAGASKTSSSVSGAAETCQEYVYDIYYAPDCELDDKILDNPISCHALDDLVFEDYSNDGCADLEDDSDDSNDENNWRNDYPDQDPDSIGEDDMKMACEKIDGLCLSETNSLSSDEGEEDLVYGMDDPDYVPDVDPKDVKNFGYDYAAYKKRIADLKTFDSDASENSDFFYCDSDLSDSDRS